MTVRSSFGDSIVTAGYKTSYDAECKKILSYKCILAAILKGVVSEYAGLSCGEIEKLIESNVSVATIPVDVDTPKRIRGDSNEDVTNKEGKRTFDLKFRTKIPNEEKDVEVIINLEMQRIFSPGYKVTQRGVYYCSRLISSQYDVDFSHSDYQKIKKVYSIWICMNADEIHKNTVIEYKLVPRNIFTGQTCEKIPPQDYDLMSLIVIGIGDSENDNNPEIINLLSVLFSNRFKMEEKLQILDEKYELPITEDSEMKGVLENMCNFSEDVFEKGMARGIEQGIEKGIEKGIEQGSKQKEKAMIELLLQSMSVQEVAAALKTTEEKINEIIK